MAPEGAIVKIAGLKKLQFSGTARCFDNEEDAMNAVQTKKYKDGDVIIIRYEGQEVGQACVKCYQQQVQFMVKEKVKKLL